MIAPAFSPVSSSLAHVQQESVSALTFARPEGPGREAFSLALAASRRDAGKPEFDAPLTDEQARAAAEEFVSISLVQPILAQLRQTNQAWGPFKPGAHEKQFGPLMDAEVALRVTKARQFPLVDAIARNLHEVSQRLVRKTDPSPEPAS